MQNAKVKCGKCWKKEAKWLPQGWFLLKEELKEEEGARKETCLLSLNLFR